MTFQDLVITPLYLFFFVGLGFLFRRHFTNNETRSYFIPALLLRFVGAISLGLIYQFYYQGGDTFNYFYHGSRWIWEAFQQDFSLGWKLLLEQGGQRQAETFQYSQHIWYYRDPNSFFIVRLVGLIDLLTFHTYSATALFFAVFSFSGSWAMYTAIQKRFQVNQKMLMLGILFWPSVIFWGSGILKDTISLGALGWATWALIHLLELRQWKLLYFIVLGISIWLIASVKFYIVICFFPLILVWIYWKRILSFRNIVLRMIISPVLLFFLLLIGIFSLEQVIEKNASYSLDNIAERAAITAYDIRYGWGARTQGDGGYDIGLPDGTVQGMLKILPAAINVTLFRPYLWEVKNPLMLLAALESTAFVGLTIWLLFFQRKAKVVLNNPFLLFCLLFSLLFAFAVGASTFNFGTLMRYKLPMVPFYLVLLAIKENRKKID